MGICEAALKRNCRRQNIKKWPYRQLHAILKKIEQSEETLRSFQVHSPAYNSSSSSSSFGSSSDFQKVEVTLNELRKQRDRIYNSNPPSSIRQRRESTSSSSSASSSTTSSPLPLLGKPSVLSESIQRSPTVVSLSHLTPTTTTTVTSSTTFAGPNVFSFPPRDMFCHGDPFLLNMGPIVDYLCDEYLFEDCLLGFTSCKLMEIVERPCTFSEVETLFS